jgi:hypothetical protein
MKKLFAVVLLVLGMTHAVRAQEHVPAAPETDPNVAADFAQTSAASAPMMQLGNGPAAHTVPAHRDLAGASLSSGIPDAIPSTMFAGTKSFALLTGPDSVATPADPSPAPRYRSELDAYRMDISIGVAIVRFRSSVFLATGVGTNTSFAYFMSDHLAVEGAVTTAFAPTIFQNEHVKYLGYGAGPKFLFWGRGQRRIEPWIHALIGGAHVFPQTALGGKNGFELQAGGGADYGVNSRVAIRIEADWVRTQLWGQSQNSGQAMLAIVYHF